MTGKTLRDKAEIFNSFFSSVTRKSRVINYLRNLDGNKLHGPNEIHPVY